MARTTALSRAAAGGDDSDDGRKRKRFPGHATDNKVTVDVVPDSDDTCLSTPPHAKADCLLLFQIEIIENRTDYDEADRRSKRSKGKSGKAKGSKAKGNNGKTQAVATVYFLSPC